MKEKVLMQNCILHIGMNKAGSSAIQEYLHNNDLGSNYYYVKLGSSNHSSYISSLFSSHPENKHDYKKRNLTKEKIEKINLIIKNKLIDEFDKKQAENYIISGEEILNLSPLELKNLQSFLKTFFKNITIVAYVREPISFIESLFQQCLKGGIINDFKIEQMYPRYQNLFEKFFQIFGSSNVFLWKYKKKNIVFDFCNRFDIPYQNSTSLITNESLTLEAISLLYAHRKFFSFGSGPNVIQENRDFIEKLKTIGTIKFTLDSNVIEAILSKSFNDLRWIENKVGDFLPREYTPGETAISHEEDLLTYADMTIRKLFDKDIGRTDVQLDWKTIAKLVEKFKMKKKELCIIHIGMPKTGSSTLQDTFCESIEDERVSYGNLPEANQSGRFSGLFMDKPENYHYFSNRGWGGEQIEAFNQKNRELLIQGFLNNDSNIELISGEDLFHLQKNEIEKMKQFLSNYFHKILIVAYVRPVKSFMESAFQQLVKNHYLGTFDFSRIYHKYKNFKRYDDVFGSENVLLWKFDPKVFPEGDIVLDFCSRLNLKPMRSKQKIVNESLSKEAISILFTYHYHSKSKTDFQQKTHLINHKLVNKIRVLGKTKFKFSSKLIEKVIENNKDDYAWILQRMDESFKDVQNENIVDEGVNTPMELFQYSVNFIPDLLNLLEEKNLNIELNNTPQTVARLVDMLMIKLSHE